MGLTARRYIAPPQGHSTFRADQIQAPEVVSFTERVLLAVLAVDREELGRNNRATVLRRSSLCGFFTLQTAISLTMHLKHWRW